MPTDIIAQRQAAREQYFSERRAKAAQDPLWGDQESH